MEETTVLQVGTSSFKFKFQILSSPISTTTTSNDALQHFLRHLDLGHYPSCCSYTEVYRDHLVPSHLSLTNVDLFPVPVTLNQTQVVAPRRTPGRAGRATAGCPAVTAGENGARLRSRITVERIAIAPSTPVKLAAPHVDWTNKLEATAFSSSS